MTTTKITTTTDNDAAHNAIARQAIRSAALAGDIFKTSGYAQELVEELLRVESATTRENIMACSNLFTNACLKLFCGSSSSAAAPAAAANNGGKKVYYESFPLPYAEFMRFSTSEGIAKPLTEEEYVLPKVLYNGGIYRNHVMKKSEDKSLTWNMYKEAKIADLKLRGIVFTREDFLLNAAKCVMSVKAKKEMWRNYGVTRDLLMGLKVYERGTGVARKKRCREASEEESCEEEDEDNKSKDTTEESDDFDEIEHSLLAKMPAKMSKEEHSEEEEEEEKTKRPIKKNKKTAPKMVEESEEEEEPAKKGKKVAAKKSRSKLSESAALALSKVGDGFEEAMEGNLSDE